MNKETRLRVLNSQHQHDYNAAWKKVETQMIAELRATHPNELREAVQSFISSLLTCPQYLKTWACDLDNEGDTTDTMPFDDEMQEQLIKHAMQLSLNMFRELELVAATKEQLDAYDAELSKIDAETQAKRKRIEELPE